MNLILLPVVAILLMAVPARPQGEIPTRVTNQNRTGELPFSTNIGTSIEHVDAATGTLNVRIPLVSNPGRGSSAQLYYQFNSNYLLLAPRTDGLGHPYWIWTIAANSGWQTNHTYMTSAITTIKCDPVNVKTRGMPPPTPATSTTTPTVANTRWRYRINQVSALAQTTAPIQTFLAQECSAA
jgi:hypothetical protein